MRAWRFVDSGKARGAFNMAVDETLAEGLRDGEGMPVLRMFGWNPPAVSLGYSQLLHREVDVEKCRRAGIDLVRRPTGGRAVLHWEELTYSVICPEGDAKLGGTIDLTCRIVGECLVLGLQLFGVDAALEMAGPKRNAPRPRTAAAPCFSSISRWEVTCKGRKLIGSAQRRMQGVILQHGSLLLGAQHRRLVELLPPSARPVRAQWTRRLEEDSIHLQACTPQKVDTSALAACLAEGFHRRLQVEMQPETLNFPERQRAEELMAEKYDDHEWTWNARPGAQEAAAGRPGLESRLNV